MKLISSSLYMSVMNDINIKQTKTAVKQKILFSLKTLIFDVYAGRPGGEVIEN
jgi:hypothetical protein